MIKRKNLLKRKTNSFAESNVLKYDFPDVRNVLQSSSLQKEILKYRKIFNCQNVSDLQMVLNVCGLSFTPDMYNGKIIVYSFGENVLLKEHFELNLSGLGVSDLVSIISCVNLESSVEYNCFVFFVFNRIFSINYQRSRFAIPGIYEGRRCYIVFSVDKIGFVYYVESI